MRTSEITRFMTHASDTSPKPKRILTGERLGENLIGIVLFFLMVFIIPLGAKPEHSPDEPRYMEIPREMVESQNWIVPILCGVPYSEKPALSYQATALSYKIFGINRFAARIPNTLATLAAALLVYILLNRVTPNRSMPMLGAILFLTSAFVIGNGVFTGPDAPFSSAVTLSLGFFFLACQETSRKKFIWLILSGISCGAAFQIKGFLAFIIPFIIIVPFLIWMKEWRKLLTYPWIPLTAAILVSLPWSIAIQRAEPGFWHYFFIEEHLHRFFSHTHDKGREPFCFYLPIIIAGLLPAGGVSVVSAAGWFRRSFLERPIARFALCWFFIPLLLFSIASCKTAPYVLPCFPAAAILLVLGIEDAFGSDPEKAKRRCRLFFNLIGYAAFFGGILTLFLFPLPWHKWFPIDNPYPEGYRLGFISVPMIILWGILTLRHRNEGVRGFLFYFYGAAPALMLTFFVLPTGLISRQISGYGIEKGLARIQFDSENDMVFSEGGVEKETAWILQRTDFVYINPSNEGSFWFARYPESRPNYYQIPLDQKYWQPLLAKAPEKRGVLITAKPPEEMRKLLPRPPVMETSYGTITIFRF